MPHVPRKALRGGISKSIFQRPCQFLAVNAHKMAPRTNQWLQERTWNAPTKGLAWVPICYALLTGSVPEDEGPFALTPNTVELVPTLGALFPRGGLASVVGLLQGYLTHQKYPPRRTLQ